MRRILLAVTAAGCRVFRNNVAQGWVGESVTHFASGTRAVVLHPGDVVVRRARPLHAGLALGSSDLIGWQSIEIRPEHVGSRVAVFTAIEVKGSRGRLTGEQGDFLMAVRAAGGDAMVARSEDEALSQLRK